MPSQSFRDRPRSSNAILPAVNTRPSFISSPSTAQKYEEISGILERQPTIFDTTNLDHQTNEYTVQPRSQTMHQPMGPNTKRNLSCARWTQFSLRLCQLGGALGLLVCGACLRNLSSIQSYAIRVPSCVDIVTSTYAIYHLARPLKNRQPSTSASYHILALIMDSGLITFYIFAAIFSDIQLENTPALDGWHSVWGSSTATQNVITATCVLSIIVGCLHLMTLSISLYMAIMFHKIARMPPDMNPLEGNLTSRHPRSVRPKRSDMSIGLSLPRRGRKSPTKEMAATLLPISFLATRNNADTSYSPHNPSTVSASRLNSSLPPLPHVYKQPRAANASHLDVSLPNSLRSTYLDQADDLTPSLPRKSSKRRSEFLSDNWFVHGPADENADPALDTVESDSPHLPSHPSINAFDFALLGKGQRYQPLAQHSPSASEDNPPISPSPRKQRRFYGSALAPLSMNPPTPPGSRLANRESQAGPLRSTSGNESRGSGRFHEDSGHGPRNSTAQLDMELGEGVGSGDIGVGAWVAPPPRSPRRNGEVKGRVVSRSGADIGGLSLSYGGAEVNTSYGGAGGLRGRNVSGGVVEVSRGLGLL